MVKILILYYGRTGVTEQMARLIEEGCKAEKAQATLMRVDEVGQVAAEDLVDFDGIIIGSPAYYGSMAWPIKKLLDDSVKFHQQLAGKVGAAFASAANVGGGIETTIHSILDAMLVHGMVVQGNPVGDHFGPGSVGPPDQRVEEQCRQLGRNVAKLVKRLVK